MGRRHGIRATWVLATMWLAIGCGSSAGDAAAACDEGDPTCPCAGDGCRGGTGGGEQTQNTGGGGGAGSSMGETDGGGAGAAAIDGGSEGADAGGTADASSGAGGTDGGGAGVLDAGAGAGTGGGASPMWSDPVSLVDDLGRLAIGNRVHVVGHGGGQLVHRSSQDDGASWSDPVVIAPAAGNYPAMYGGLFALGDTVYLLTAEADMASGPRQLQFRRSDDGGQSWGDPVPVTGAGETIFRARIVASGDHVHVVGGGPPTPSGSVRYYRSSDRGDSWDPVVTLAQDLGEYGGGQTVAVDGDTVHVGYTTVVNGVGGGPTLYVRSADAGDNWSSPVMIGEDSTESMRQARVQIVAAGGRVFACWQREAEFTGAPLLPDRLGYNTSDDGGMTWGTAQVLPLDTGVERNHQQVWMTRSGVHLAWRHGNSAADPAGYMHSPDLGATWEQRAIAIDTGEVNHPFSIVADTAAVHLLTGPGGSMKYAYKRLQ